MEELDPLTGEVREVETVADGEGVCFTRTFETGMSRIYFVRKKMTDVSMKKAATFPYRHPHYTDPVLATFGPDAKFRRTMENVLTIDRCTYELGEMAGTRRSLRRWKSCRHEREIREKLSMTCKIYY